MKKLFKTILISLIVIICQSNEQLKEYKIVLNAFDAGVGKVKINIVTNFPDGTNFKLSIWRGFYVKEDNELYSGDLSTKNFSVINGKFETIVILNDTKWYNEHQRLVKALPDDIKPITKISDKITIDVLYTPAAPQPSYVVKTLGTKGKFVSGKGAENFGTIKVFSVTQEFFSPMQGGFKKSSEYASYQSLKISGTYAISKETPLMPEYKPSDPLEALSHVKYLPKGFRIRILSIKEKENFPWYEVQAMDKIGNSVGKGWINSTALVGQEILLIK